MEKLSKTKEEFDQFFEEKLAGKIDHLDEKREQLRKRRNKQLGFTGLAILPLIILSQFTAMEDYTIYIFLVGAVIAGIGIKKIVDTNKEFSSSMKQEIVQEIVTFINPAFHYDPKKFVPKSTFLDTELFSIKPNRYRGDDAIWGYVYDQDISELDLDQETASETAASKNTTNLKEAIPDLTGQKGSPSSTEEKQKQLEEIPRTEIFFSEVDASYVESGGSNDDHDKVTTIFRGLFFVVDFNKDFEGVTTIAPKQKLFSKLNVTKGSFRRKIKLEEIELDNLEFTEQFTVKTTDEGKARYILTPAFMEKTLSFVDGTKEKELNRIKEKVESEADLDMNKVSKVFDFVKKHVNVPYFSFKDGKMYFLLHTKQDHFEFDMNKKIEKEALYSYFDDINRALELVEELDLNLKLWNKS